MLVTVAVYSGNFAFIMPYFKLYFSLSGVCMAGRVCTVINASLTRAVYTGPAMNPGSASVKRTGVDNSVTKVSTHSFYLF